MSSSEMLTAIASPYLNKPPMRAMFHLARHHAVVGKTQRAASRCSCGTGGSSVAHRVEAGGDPLLRIAFYRAIASLQAYFQQDSEEPRSEVAPVSSSGKADANG